MLRMLHRTFFQEISVIFEERTVPISYLMSLGQNRSLQKEALLFFFHWQLYDSDCISIELIQTLISVELLGCFDGSRPEVPSCLS